MFAKLTPKQTRFVDEYLVDMNGGAAAIRAGYGVPGSRVAAHRLLTRANVRAEIEARQGRDTRRLQLERQDAIKGLLDAVEQARAMGDPGAMIAGWSAIGKMLGFYEPSRHSVNLEAIRTGMPGRFEQMSDRQLLDVLGQG